MVTYWIIEPVVDRLRGKGEKSFFKGGKLCSKNFHIQIGICVVILATGSPAKPSMKSTSSCLAKPLPAKNYAEIALG